MLSKIKRHFNTLISQKKLGDHHRHSHQTLPTDILQNSNTISIPTKICLRCLSSFCFSLKRQLECFYMLFDSLEQFLLIILRFIQIVMVNQTSTYHTTSAATSINIKWKRKTIGTTIYTKVKKAHESGIRYLIIIDIRTNRTYGEHDENFMGYIMLQDRSKVNILIQSWNEIDEVLKDTIQDDVKLFYDLFISIYDHLFFCFILITSVLCKHIRCLMLVLMIVW